MSKDLFIQAKKVMPGGVNSPVRAFGSVGMEPVFIKKGVGAEVTDSDDNSYIDYVCSWGPLILGHAHPQVVQAVKDASADGLTFGAPTQSEIILAQMICDAVSNVEMVRMVSSGTEAVMSAIRLARAATGRDRILKFEGCYHGHSDGLLVKSGSGGLTFGHPSSLGVPEDYIKNTIISGYNNCEMTEEIFNKYGDSIAAVIVEPIAGNMGLILPDIEFLKQLRALTNRCGALLIFDEVITGFRLCYGSAGDYYKIQPDLTTFGKIVGGGMPVGAYGGRRDIMSMVSPLGGVYQAGTLSGNPVAMAAGIKTLEILRDNPSVYCQMERYAAELSAAFEKYSAQYGIPACVNSIGSMLSVFFTQTPVVDYSSALDSDTVMFAEYFRHMLRRGIYIPPSQFEVMFVSAAHDGRTTQKTIEAIKDTMKYLGKGN